jgi:NADPH:quinone reductase-like Zn-dependent oxidoreductase
MRAAVLAAPRRFEIVEVERPAPGRGEVLVQLEGSGVWATSAWQGRAWFRYPFRPARRARGLGPRGGARPSRVGFAPGDRVAILPAPRSRSTTSPRRTGSSGS